VKIVNINPIEDSRWDKFVQNHPEGTIFHLSNWGKVIRKTYGYEPYYLVLEDKSKNIHGGWPFFLVNNGIMGKKLISIPFTDYIKPLISSENDYQDFFEKISEIYQKEKCKNIEIRGEIRNSKNTFLNPNVSFKNFILDLQKKTENDVWNNLHDSVKRGIKKAKKYKLTAFISDDLSAVDIFYKMNTMTRRKHGVIPQPYKFFLNLWKYVILKKMGFVMLATLNGKPISSAIFLNYNRTIFYKYGASYTEYLNYRPNNLIFWEMLNWSIKHNFKYFDFGRVSLDNEGLMSFKRHWGAEEIDLTYYYYPEIRGISTMKQSSLKYKIATSILRKTPTKILELLGNNFYRYLT